MKVLYAIQGTGNGHLSRAREIIPLLRKRCTVDILISGNQADVEFPFEVKYRLRGLSFIFGKRGGIDLWNTYIEANTKRFFKEIKGVPVKDYNFVINDFEPVSAWACYKKNIPCIAFSHQSALLDKNVPRPRNTDLLGQFILNNYAPSNLQFGLHFGRYSKNIYTPVIRSEVRSLKNIDRNHYTVYLPSYSDDMLIDILGKVDKETHWQVFSKRSKRASRHKSIEIFPVTNEGFIKSMASSTGVLCGAGFETPAEALFLGKKLMVVPMQNQYEQQCNAAALESMGIPVIKKLKEKNIEKIRDWVSSGLKIEISYPDITEKLINGIFEAYISSLSDKSLWRKKYKLEF